MLFTGATDRPTGAKMNATDYRNAFAAAVTAHGFSVTAEQIADIADAVWSAAQLMAQDEATFRAALRVPQ